MADVCVWYFSNRGIAQLAYFQICSHAINKRIYGFVRYPEMHSQPVISCSIKCIRWTILSFLRLELISSEWILGIEPVICTSAVLYRTPALITIHYYAIISFSSVAHLMWLCCVLFCCTVCFCNYLVERSIDSIDQFNNFHNYLQCLMVSWISINSLFSDRPFSDDRQRMWNNS